MPDFKFYPKAEVPLEITLSPQEQQEILTAYETRTTPNSCLSTTFTQILAFLRRCKEQS